MPSASANMSAKFIDQIEMSAAEVCEIERPGRGDQADDRQHQRQAGGHLDLVDELALVSRSRWASTGSVRTPRDALGVVRGPACLAGTGGPSASGSGRPRRGAGSWPGRRGSWARAVGLVAGDGVGHLLQRVEASGRCAMKRRSGRRRRARCGAPRRPGQGGGVDVVFADGDEAACRRPSTRRQGPVRRHGGRR